MATRNSSANAIPSPTTPRETDYEELMANGRHTDVGAWRPSITSTNDTDVYAGRNTEYFGSTIDRLNPTTVVPERMASAPRGSMIFDVVAIPDPAEFGILEENSNAGRKPRKFNGRLRMWPGILLLIVIGVASAALVAYYARQTYFDTVDRTDETLSNRKRIRGDDGDWIFIDEDLDVPGNPSVYPDRECEHLNYISKNNMIYGVTSDGTEIKLPIKGINWSGMETGHAIPYGLWDNIQNGTTVFQVAAFLARNNFNSVRLPLSVYHILENSTPDISFINTNTNKAIEAEEYRTLLKTIVQALAYRGISVLLDMHTLTPTDTGELWYNEEISENDLLDAIDILGEDLCSATYWNIVGLDLKNEPAAAKWGTRNPKKDWHMAAEKLGNRMLAACPKWTAQVEGISSSHSINLFGSNFFYYDWWGGGLQGAKEDPIVLNTVQKVVYSPHYYSPAVHPAPYFYRSGRNQGGRLKDYVERPDDELRVVVNRTMHDMFGFLTSTQDFAVVMGEFGGLFGTDTHPLKTTSRVIEYTIDFLVNPSNKYGGGYVWSLNPESAYEYNPVDTRGFFQYGLLDDDWLSVHAEYLDVLKKFDDMEDMKMFPCVQSS